MSLFNEIANYWMEGTLRTFEAVSRGFGSPASDPPPVTPYEVIYESGKVSLRHYQPAQRRHRTPIILVYALIKRIKSALRVCVERRLGKELES